MRKVKVFEPVGLPLRVLTPPDGLSDEALMSAISTGWNYTIASINYHAVGFGSHTTAAWAPLVRIDRRYTVALYPYLVDKVLQRQPGVCGSLFLFGRKPR